MMMTIWRKMKLYSLAGLGCWRKAPFGARPSRRNGDPASPFAGELSVTAPATGSGQHQRRLACLAAAAAAGALAWQQL